MLELVFPVDSEERIARNILMLCQDHARLTVESFRRLLAMVDGLAVGDIAGLRARLGEVQEFRRQAEEIRMTALREIGAVGRLLINREDFYRLVSKTGELADRIEELAILLHQMGEMGWRMAGELEGGLRGMAEAAFEALVKLRESLMSLGLSSERSALLTREVDERERAVDALYRGFKVEVYTSGSELPLILLLSDVAEELERVVDAAREGADLVRILAL